MTKSMTLAGLPRAGANSKPHRYKQSTKNEELFENMSFSKNPFEDFNEKKQYKIFHLEQTTPWNTRPMKTTTEYVPCKQ